MNVDVESLPIELEQGELVTRYVEWGDMAVRYGHTGWTDEPVVFLEVGPVEAMRAFGDHARTRLA